MDRHITHIFLFWFYYVRKGRDKVQVTTCRHLNYGVCIRSLLPVRMWFVIRWSNKKCWQKKGETRDRIHTRLPFCDHFVNTIYCARIWGAHKHDDKDSSLLGYDNVSIGSDRLLEQPAATSYKVYAVSSYTTLTFKIVTESFTSQIFTNWHHVILEKTWICITDQTHT